MSEDRNVLRLAEHLVSELLAGLRTIDCELVGFTGEGRCIEPAVAVRWESGFADLVCEQHAATAENRGAVVVYPNRHNGTLASPPLFEAGGRP